MKQSSCDDALRQQLTFILTNSIFIIVQGQKQDSLPQFRDNSEIHSTMQHKMKGKEHKMHCIKYQENIASTELQSQQHRVLC